MTRKTIPANLEETVGNNKDCLALRFLRHGKVETEVTFEQLHHDVELLAAELQNLGVGHGARVVLFIPKSLFGVVAHFAIQTIGAIAVPLNPGFTKSEMKYLLTDSSPELIIVDPEKQSWIEEIYTGCKTYTVATAGKYQSPAHVHCDRSSASKREIQPDDPALIIYTSGTTGNPKGAVLTHRNLLNDARNIKEVWEITATDVLCHALPLFHVHGLCFALQTPLLAGARIDLLDAFKPEQVIAKLSINNTRERCSVFMAVPAMYTKLLDYAEGGDFDFSHLRLLTSGSAPLPVKEFRRIADLFGQEPVEREGMSETGMNFSNPLHGDRIPGSIGLPLPGLEVRIVNTDTLEDVAPGGVGELWLKSESITREYWQKPQETKDTYQEDWFKTGDLCRVDQDGYYYLTDRIKHIIISGGENVSAKEVETVIDKFAGVEESVVVGKENEKWGEVVVAAVKVDPGTIIEEDDIKMFCKQHLHTWKCPKKVLFIHDIPRNTMGKVLKEEVKNYFS